MIAIEVDGKRIEVDNEKEARKALAKASREQRKVESARAAEYQQARKNGECAAYNVLARKLSAEPFPPAWRFYGPDDKWSEHLFQMVKPDYADCAYRKANVNHENGRIEVDFYGFDWLGAVCNGGGFAWLIILRDRTDSKVWCYALGIQGEQYALLECPGIALEDFHKANDAE